MPFVSNRGHLCGSWQQNQTRTLIGDSNEQQLPYKAGGGVHLLITQLHSNLCSIYIQDLFHMYTILIHLESNTLD